VLIYSKLQSKSFDYLYEETQKLTCTTSASRYYSFTARNWILVFDPEKLTCIKTAYKSPGCYSPLYSLPSLWKIYKRISQLSPFNHAVTTSTREPPTCARIRADICREGDAICSKNRKILHIARISRSYWLRSPILAPGYPIWKILSLINSFWVAHGFSMVLYRY